MYIVRVPLGVANKQLTALDRLEENIGSAHASLYQTLRKRDVGRGRCDSRFHDRRYILNHDSRRGSISAERNQEVSDGGGVVR